VRRISEGVPQSLDGSVKAAVEIDEGIRRPQPVAKVFPRNDFAGVLHKHTQNLERLFLQLQLDPTLAHLAGPNIDLQDSKAKKMRGLSWRRQHVCKTGVYTPLEVSSLSLLIHRCQTV